MIALFLRDFRLALRAGGGAGQAIGFFLIAVTLMAFGVGPAPELLAAAAPGVVWVFALLACQLSLDRVFQQDFDDGSLELLAQAGPPLEAAALAKALAHWAVTGLPLAIAAPLGGLMLGFPIEAAPTLALSLLLGTPALSFVGSVGAALTVGLRRGGLLLSLLVLPLTIPTLVFGALATRAAVLGIDAGPTLLLLGAVTLGAAALSPFAAAGALRVSLS